MTTLPFLTQLSTTAIHHNHRYGVVLTGDVEWQSQEIQSYLKNKANSAAYVLGELEVPGTQTIPFNKGQHLLGQECQVLICDFRNAFDANSFTAALGALVGGGVLLVLPHKQSDTTTLDKSTFSELWIKRQFDKLYGLSQDMSPQNLEQLMSQLPQMVEVEHCVDQYEQQSHAIEAIQKVMFGHRKRPLVLTADRGRGKSSALGMASAKIIQVKKAVTIVVTAPNVKAVQPLFEHALKQLPHSTMLNRHTLVHEQSNIVFIAPDELLRTQPDCDLLLVDEAAAIPLPMLKRMVERYHRMVFSTTVHGYEGSGRGFGLKFEKWLSQHRPNWRSFKLEQPIRWSVGDPLEEWLFETFLLNSDIEALPENLQTSSTTWHQFDKQALLDNPYILDQCFGLLVSAHYQTSPNDLIQLLDNPQMSLHALFVEKRCLGCVLVVEEGGLQPNMIEDIQLGKRRPRGHLAPALIANHLGIPLAAEQTCLRIMRIAVHPDIQGQGYGHQMMTHLVQSAGHFDYLATSFGATDELVDFWFSNGFEPMHLGHQRDQASGCHSLLMCRALTKSSQVWLEQGKSHFNSSFRYLISTSYNELEASIVRSLLASLSCQTVSQQNLAMLNHYILGGNGFDSVGFMFENMIFELNRDQLRRVSDLIIWKVLQKKSWSECSELTNFTGRKQTEASLRKDLELVISELGLNPNLQCK
ncbi:GNAT family N-acetyltransferase [Vibrio sp. D404a]|uniref:tRNA(Met) cytidine acetyltransferase TmcA n=2 Tax=Vibrio TaxID=662 RepID=UPI0025536488|nr:MULTISPECIES: GNAT family N-acetyltransferase [unclassified Vibrio]MDK9736928.1 GNAT family N-acetyltransferase [Vibrio sp. D404a]MDK9795654.1 GNAT family N-acetyltransferase [Vibrio sp. D449a]